MKIAVGGFGHESNTFSTIPTRYEDLRFARGEELIAAEIWRQVRDGHEIVPLVRAWAQPSGPVTPDCYRRVADELLSGLEKSLPLDAVFLSLHGAMEVEGLGDGEGELLREIRGLVGEDVFIAGTLDLHGNLSGEFVRRCNLLTALRTAPHRDSRETELRGVRLTMACLQEGLRPITELIKLPLLLPGESAVTEVEPARSLYARLPDIDAQPGILASSLLIGCAWTDSPHTSVSVLITGTDAAAVRRQALELAEEIWRVRAEFGPDVPTAEIDEAIRMALEAPQRPVFLSDSGDNTTAGGAGDSPFVLERLVALGVKDAVMAGICDPAAVQRCEQAGERNGVDLVIGGKLDQQFAQPFAARATVRRVVRTDRGPRAVVDIEGVTTVLQTDRAAFTCLRDFEELGIDPGRKKIVVVKVGYLFSELRDFAPKSIMALTPGFADQRLDRLPYRKLRRPIYPLDPQTTWRV